ncbi:hypothetical protein CFC21_078804 [Triticum aestivum]|uniref:DUF6598 domain-containing protein n=2 Tax=Triticum aestivum TaxID=4565 RepID=A0A9R1L195_WHEAT|nr:uncharacterized protein LOC123122323 [Triticum aestivum]KAF7073881.1 hypothetical protein CFC21_078801 [Triticum aestivum]KAF7073884.1 hypothetical protein CFC21_078804 [Triticum aestivum]
MAAGGLAGTELVSTGGAEAGNNARVTGRGKRKALRKARQKKPSSYRRDDRRDREEFMRALREEEPIELREEDEIPDYRELWDCLYADHFGSFDDQTALGPMRHTFEPIPSYAAPDCTLQIFYIRVTEISKDGLQWPLHVHGLVAARDSVDHNRNFLFNRTRDDCQTLTQEDPWLMLTGPSRALVLIDPIAFEVQLKVKSKTEPGKDELLAFKVFSYHKAYHSDEVESTRITCKRCTLEFAYAPLLPSVEATVTVQVIDGSWDDHVQGVVTCRTASMENGEMVLLASRDGKMPVNSDGVIELSRRVVSVELRGQLLVSVLGRGTGDKKGLVATDTALFTQMNAGTSHGVCDLGFCKVQVTVAWSFLSTLADMLLSA